MSNNIIFANNASALLAATINSTDLTIQLAAGYGANFPSPTGDRFFMLTLEDDAGTIEIVKITGRDNDNLTMDGISDRGKEGTSAAAHIVSTTRCELRLTKLVMEEFLQKNGGTMQGAINMNAQNLVDALINGSSTVFSQGKIIGVSLQGHATVTDNIITVPTDGTSRATAGGAELLAIGDDIVAQLDSEGVIILDSATIGVKIIDGAYLRVYKTWDDAEATEHVSFLSMFTTNGVDADDDEIGIFNFEFTEISRVDWDTPFNMAGNEIQFVSLVDFSLKKQAVDGESTTELDYELGSYVVLTLTADIASLTLTNPPAVDVGVFRIKIIQDSTARTITWPSSVKWAGGTEPTLSTDSGAIDFVDLWTDDGGVTWYGASNTDWQ